MTTKSAFLASATPLPVAVGGQNLTAEPREFSSGSVGYYLSGKVTVTLPNGEAVRIQCSGSFVAVGSKEWAK